MRGVSKDETEALTTTRARSRLKKIAAALVVLILVLAAGVYLGGPTLASAIAKSKIERTLPDGTVITVDSVSLSWNGASRVAGLRLHSPEGHTATLEGTLDQSLLSLIKGRGRGDLGIVVLSGSADINAEALGSSTTPRPSPTTDKPSGQAGKPSIATPTRIELGSDFAVTIQLKDFELTIREASAPAVSIVLSGNAQAKADEPATVSLTGSIVSVADSSSVGVVDLDLRAPGLLSRDGSVTLSHAPAMEGTATLTDFPAALVQAFLPAGTGFDVSRDVGPSITATVIADSSPGNPTEIAVNVRAANLIAHGSFTQEKSILRTHPEVGFSLRINNLTPALAGLLGDESPVVIQKDAGAILQLTSMTLDLDSIARAGVFGEGSASAAGEYSANPITVIVKDHRTPIAIAAPRGRFVFAGNTLTLDARSPAISLGEESEALRGVSLDAIISGIGSAMQAESAVTVNAVQTAALGAWLGTGTPAGSRLVQLNDTVSIKADPKLVGGALQAPFSLIGTGYRVAGKLSREDGAVTAAANIEISNTELIDSLAGLQAGLAQELLGSTAKLAVSLEPAAAEVSLTADRLATLSPVRFDFDSERLSLAQPVELRAQITPSAMAMLRGTQNEAHKVQLSEPIDLRVRIDSLALPGSAGEVFAIDTTVQAQKLVIERSGEAAHESIQEYSGFKARLNSIEGQPRHVRIFVQLQEQGHQVMLADLTASRVLDDAGAFTPEAAGLTGAVKLTQAGTPLLDMLTGSGVLSGLLGPTVDADLQLAEFPQDSGTLTGVVTSERTTGEIHAKVNGNEITLTQPATLQLSEITQRFSYQFTPLLPVVGALTKDPAAHRPATITIETVHIPVPFDLGGLGFTAWIDPGTARIIAESELAGLLQGSPTIGDSFSPFSVSMTNGVLQVTQLMLPLGEFEVSATGSYDLTSRTENVFVQLPTGALLSEALGGNNDIAGQILGRFLNIGLRKSGDLGAANAWQIDTSSSIENSTPPEEEILNTVRDLLDIFGG